MSEYILNKLKLLGFRIEQSGCHYKVYDSNNNMIKDCNGKNKLREFTYNRFRIYKKNMEKQINKKTN